MNLIFLTLAFFISVFLAGIIIPRILLISLRKKLYDLPNERKIHKVAVPRLGGVSFFPTVLFTVCFISAVRTLLGYESPALYVAYLVPKILLLISGMTLLYLIGIADDLIGIRYRQKLVVQVICALFFPISGLWINNLYGLFGIHELCAGFGIPFTIVTVVFITNAINLIDGIDGLASGLSSVALLVFAFLFVEERMFTYALVAVSTLGVLVPFFYYNVFGKAERCRKIFMGDTGSLMLGYTLSFLAIRYSQYTPDVIKYKEGAFVIAFSTLIIPSFDVVRVVFVRLRNGKSPFQPDQNHIHHKLLAIGLTPCQAMITLLLISCTFCISNIILMPYVNNTIMLFVDILVWAGLNLWWDRILKNDSNK